MICIEKELNEKSKELKQLIGHLERKRGKEPKGSLRVTKRQKQYSFYHYLEEKKEGFPVGKYISKSNMELIRSLAQKEYDLQILKWAKECVSRLDGFMEVYRNNKCAAAYEKLKEAKRQFVNPYEMPCEKYVEYWLSIPYTGKRLDLEENHFITEKGEKVRSKSEKILADKFFRMGVPYKYECPLNLKGFGTVYPDFTLLNKRTQREFYWEHLGMMDNQEYSQKAIMKIHTYELNKIFQGKQLLLSYEIKNNLNTEVVDALIKEYLL